MVRKSEFSPAPHYKKMYSRRRSVRKSRKSRKTPSRKGVRFAKAPRNTVALIKSVVRRQAETKQAAFYGQGTGGTYPQTGAYATRGYFTQNATITTVSGDVKMLLPFVQQGTEDWQRVGNKINPTYMKIQGHCKVALSQMSTPTFAPTDIYAVCYVLTSKTWKSYQALLNLDLTRLLKTQEGSTVGFDGTYWASRLAVSEDDFTLIKKKVMRLRYSGITGTGGSIVSLANSHDYSANYSMVLTQRQLPATLLYPEQSSTIPAAYANTPTNFAPFLVIGYYTADGSALGPSPVILDNTYVVNMKYKDV